MNAEVEVGPPLPPEHQPATSVSTLVVVIVALLICVFFIHLLIHSRKGKDVSMTDDSLADNSDDAEKAETERITKKTERFASAGQVVKVDGRGHLVSVGPPPPESSVNDVHLAREQDQALMQLAVQYEEMRAPPWQYEVAFEIPDMAAGSTAIGRKAQALSAMMTPPSVAGSQRGTSARQSLWFMNFGQNKIGAASEIACKDLHQRLNAQYFSIVAARRKDLLQQIIALTQGAADVKPPVAAARHSAKCGQTRIVFDTQDEAEGMAERLNIAYRETIQPEIDRVLAEIRSEALKSA